ncbi:hypothetical protein [Paenibacillus agilis]|uniref:DUF4352 domain-containing protein n=1 Tax=Paenibacillus agilis TaxID=3020863 RepID=A0A559J177_9BACL|nr:hypothetical protein [Paenibacillus agilis]TVX93627.1 hypothetical protein FPZ44_11495 [Paenibacillus agilis]
MKKIKSMYVWGIVVILLLTSACGGAAQSGSPASPPAEQKPVDQQVKKERTQSLIKQVPILMIVDQTKQEGFEGNMFYFTVEQVPEGYALAEMKWISDNHQIVSTFEEASKNGATGGDGFYLSGNGQYSGFIYDDKMKGEQGQVVFVFRNDDKEELTWKQNITLK